MTIDEQTLKDERKEGMLLKTSAAVTFLLIGVPDGSSTM